MDKPEWHEEYVDWLDEQAKKGRNGQPHDFCNYREWLFHYKKLELEDLP